VPSVLTDWRSSRQASCMQMQAEGVSRRDLLGVAGAAIVAAPAIANADTEYPNVPFLGGSDSVRESLFLPSHAHAFPQLSCLCATRQGRYVSFRASANL